MTLQDFTDIIKSHDRKAKRENRDLASEVGIETPKIAKAPVTRTQTATKAIIKRSTTKKAATTTPKKVGSRVKRLSTKKVISQAPVAPVAPAAPTAWRNIFWSHYKLKIYFDLNLHLILNLILFSQIFIKVINKKFKCNEMNFIVFEWI